VTEVQWLVTCVERGRFEMLLFVVFTEGASKRITHLSVILFRG
jgi:hypothetical protein